MASDTTGSQLLALPDHCLLAVMQCCDTRSVLSAATAHSRLQQAAVEALSSISAGQLDQPQSDSLLLYLAKHGQHVRSMTLRASREDMQLCELPPSLSKLDSLQLANMHMQPDVLRAGLPLMRLELSHCTLLDGAQGLAAALMQLRDLQHLSVFHVYMHTQVMGRQALAFPTDVLTHLVQLTSLRLQGIACRSRSSSSDPSSALQPLQALTRLADLQLRTGCDVTADSLSRADQLTRLVLSGQLFEPHALAGKSQLQHLTLKLCKLVPGADVAQLLSELQHPTQLTHLDLMGSCLWEGDLSGPSPPPAAYASLTASSWLQHLNITWNTLPAVAWQYMCPPGRTLPQLQFLDITGVTETDGSPALPDTSAFVSCCPSLHTLTINMPCSTAQLAPLQRLTGLHTLVVGAGEADDLEGVQALCQLTGLQDLQLVVSHNADARFRTWTCLSFKTHRRACCS